MRIAVTGGHGFLGSHVRLKLRMMGHEVLSLGREESSVSGHIDAVIHCAGINRGQDKQVRAGNVAAAVQLTRRMDTWGLAPSRLVYANSIQSGRQSAYGAGKSEAGGILARWAARSGSDYIDVRLPNLYGEGGRPEYNSFVATFVSRAARRMPLQVDSDAEVHLVYAGDAAAALAQAADSGIVDALALRGDVVTVPAVSELVEEQAKRYRRGEMPELTAPFEARVFSMLRRVIGRMPDFLQPSLHKDVRGWLFEGIRHQSAGQVFFSSTVPGASRGGHFHLRKFERFVILEGAAELRCKDLLNGQERLYRMARGAVADMWVLDQHALTNVGTSPLLAGFWISEHFNELDPDTYREADMACES